MSQVSEILMRYFAALSLIAGVVAAILGVGAIAAGAAGIAVARFLLGNAARIERQAE